MSKNFFPLCFSIIWIVSVTAFSYKGNLLSKSHWGLETAIFYSWGKGEDRIAESVIIDQFIDMDWAFSQIRRAFFWRVESGIIIDHWLMESKVSCVKDSAHISFEKDDNRPCKNKLMLVMSQNIVMLTWNVVSVHHCDLNTQSFLFVEVDRMCFVNFKSFLYEVDC